MPSTGKRVTKNELCELGVFKCYLWQEEVVCLWTDCLTTIEVLAHHVAIINPPNTRAGSNGDILPWSVAVYQLLPASHCLYIKWLIPLPSHQEVDHFSMSAFTFLIHSSVVHFHSSYTLITYFLSLPTNLFCHDLTSLF